MNILAEGVEDINKEQTLLKSEQYEAKNDEMLNTVKGTKMAGVNVLRYKEQREEC